MAEDYIEQVFVNPEEYQGLIGSESSELNVAESATGGTRLNEFLYALPKELMEDAGIPYEPEISEQQALSLESAYMSGEEPGDSEEVYTTRSHQPVEGFFSNMAKKFFNKYKGKIGDKIGDLAHRYLGIDPETGKIIGSIAGNLIFNTGGKDNILGQIGKVVLDKIVSGKWKRKVQPFVPPRPDMPSPSAEDEYRPQEGDYQDFYNLRDQCLSNRQLFEDSDFPATDSSLYFSRDAPYGIEWKRPSELVQDPLLFVEGHSRFDVKQGTLGNCWMLAAVASLTLQDELFYRVVPPDQSFTENYAGIFHFQFWQYGKWVDVVIDDRLPVMNGELVYMHSETQNEFWEALLEKAYAKIHGSYEALKGGTTSEALEDFTGGLTELINLKENPPRNLLQIIMKSFQMGSLLGASIQGEPGQISEGRLSSGLISQHAYTISGAQMIKNEWGREVPLLRVRNPWGKGEGEWQGAWSDNSREWNSVSDSDKRAMGLSFDHDGEFWIEYRDFLRHFDTVEICNLGPEVMNEVAEMTGVRPSYEGQWRSKAHHGKWIENETAGGCRNFIESFSWNPQLLIQLTADSSGDGLCSVIFAVLQKYRRQLKIQGQSMLPIGFAVYKVDDDIDNALDRDYFERTRTTARSPVFINLREVTCRFRLPQGSYVFVPSTYEPGQEADFMIRIFSDNEFNSSGLG